MTVQILCKILLENDYATFVHNRARKGLQRKPLLQHTGLQIHTVAPSSATPRGRASYRLHCYLFALQHTCTTTQMHNSWLPLLPDISNRSECKGPEKFSVLTVKTNILQASRDGVIND